MSRALRRSIARFLRKKAEVCVEVTISKKMALQLAAELERLVEPDIEIEDFDPDAAWQAKA